MHTRQVLAAEALRVHPPDVEAGIAAVAAKLARIPAGPDPADQAAVEAAAQELRELSMAGLRQVGGLLPLAYILSRGCRRAAPRRVVPAGRVCGPLMAHRGRQRAAAAGLEQRRVLRVLDDSADLQVKSSS